MPLNNTQRSELLSSLLRDGIAASRDASRGQCDTTLLGVSKRLSDMVVEFSKSNLHGEEMLGKIIIQSVRELVDSGK